MVELLIVKETSGLKILDILHVSLVAERYRSSEYSETHGYDTSQTIQSDHCGQNYAAQQEYDTAPATSSQLEHVTRQEHTEEDSAEVAEVEESDICK